MTNERLRLALLESRYGPAIGRDLANERLGWLVSSSNRRVSFILLFCLANGRDLLHLDKNAGLTSRANSSITAVSLLLKRTVNNFRKGELTAIGR